MKSPGLRDLFRGHGGQEDRRVPLLESFRKSAIIVSVVEKVFPPIDRQLLTDEIHPLAPVAIETQGFHAGLHGATVYGIGEG